MNTIKFYWMSNWKMIVPVFVACFLMIALPYMLPQGNVDSDLQPSPIHRYTSSWFTDGELNALGKHELGKEVLLVGYGRSVNGTLYISNMPGLSENTDMEALAAYGIHDVEIPEISSTSNNSSTLLTLSGTLRLTDSGGCCLEDVILEEGRYTPSKHSLEYIAFSTKYYTKIGDMLDNYEVNVFNTEIGNSVVDTLDSMIVDLKNTTFYEKNKLIELLKELRLCYNRPEIINTVHVYRKDQIDYLRSNIYENFLSWGQLREIRAN